MSFQIESLPFSLLEHPVDPKQKSLFQSWRANDLHRAVMEHAEHLVILTMDRQTGLPVDLYKGEKSLAAKVLGNGWQADFANSSGSDEIMKAYEAAQFGEPTFQFVSHQGSRNGAKFDVSYERLVLPLKTGGGLQQFVTLSTLVSFAIQPTLARNHNSEPSPSRKANSQILLGMEERASLAHLESARSSEL